jgi:glycosyltransferase involved in cell wall biosynthesis
METAGGPTAPRRIRVRYLIKGLGPGGAEQLLVAAVAAHDRGAFEFDVDYLLPWKDALVEPLRARDVGCTCFDVRTEYDLRWAARLRRQLVSDPVDILHMHSPYPGAIARLVVATLPRRVRPRVVYTLHNTWRSFRLPTRMLNAVTMPLDAHDFVVSREAQTSIWSPLRSRSEVVVHGIVLDDVRAVRASREQVRAEYGIAPNEVVIGTIANLRANKDWPNLLGAARRIIDRGLPVQFLCVGQGPLEQEVAARRDELGLADRVRLLGHRDDAVRIMAGCDIFVLASYYEGLPVALMEAFALGLPVVATAVGGVPEMIRAGVEGVLVRPRDPDALADALATLACDANLRDEMGKNAARRAERYDIRNAVSRIETVYRELAAR